MKRQDVIIVARQISQETAVWNEDAERELRRALREDLSKNLAEDEPIPCSKQEEWVAFGAFVFGNVMDIGDDPDRKLSRVIDIACQYPNLRQAAINRLVLKFCGTVKEHELDKKSAIYHPDASLITNIITTIVKPSVASRVEHFQYSYPWLRTMDASVDDMVENQVQEALWKQMSFDAPLQDESLQKYFHRFVKFGLMRMAERGVSRATVKRSFVKSNESLNARMCTNYHSWDKVADPATLQEEPPGEYLTAQTLLKFTDRLTPSLRAVMEAYLAEEGPKKIRVERVAQKLGVSNDAAERSFGRARAAFRTMEGEILCELDRIADSGGQESGNGRIR